ncbi:MAG: N-acetyltransferase [Sulfurospirillum sp.]|nr:N-acetyltransferase [Sulfurospirillum sp.]
MIFYTKAKLSDIMSMQELVSDEVKRGIILHRSNDEIATNIRSYILAKDGAKIIGFGALHFHAFDLAEVRSLVVDANYRGRGIGKTIIEEMLKEGEKLAVKKIFALTYMKNFFQVLGFIEIPKESLPAHKIWADCIKCKHFPICDEIALIKTI